VLEEDRCAEEAAKMAVVVDSVVVVEEVAEEAIVEDTARSSPDCPARALGKI
jgi:hypothetical protein